MAAKPSKTAKSVLENMRNPIFPVKLGILLEPITTLTIMAGALSHIRVLDLSRVLAGP